MDKSYICDVTKMVSTWLPTGNKNIDIEAEQWWTSAVSAQNGVPHQSFDTA